MKTQAILGLTAVLLLSCSHGSDIAIRVKGNRNALSSSAIDAADRGRALLREGNTAMAIEALRLAIRHDPDSVVALNALAVAYDRVGRFDLSRRYYEQALALEPANSKILGNLAVSMRMQGHEREALDYAEEARRLQQPSLTAAPSQPESLAARESAPPPRLPLPERPAITAERASQPPLTSMPVPVERPVAAQSPTAGGPRAPAAPRTVVQPKPRTSPPAASHAERAAPASIQTRTPPLRVVNAVGRNGMARRFSQFAGTWGWTSRQLFDSRARPARTLIVSPHLGSRRLEALVKTLPFTPRVTRGKDNAIVIILGRDAIGFDRHLLRRMDVALRFTPSRQPTLEEAVAYLGKNDPAEVTTTSIRQRKRQLDADHAG